MSGLTEFQPKPGWLQRTMREAANEVALERLFERLVLAVNEGDLAKVERHARRLANEAKRRVGP